jgi:hypothetical protein
MRDFLHALRSRTIWADHAIPPEEWKYRNLKRIALPVIDVAFITVGVGGAANQVPALSEFYPDVMVDFFCWLFASFALLALFGVAFPHQWRVEIAAKLLILGALLGFAAALIMIIVEAGGGGSRVYILGGLAIPLTVVVWRLSILGSEWADRSRAKRAGR